MSQVDVLKAEFNNLQQYDPDWWSGDNYMKKDRDGIYFNCDEVLAIFDKIFKAESSELEG